VYRESGLPWSVRSFIKKFILEALGMAARRLVEEIKFTLAPKHFKTIKDTEVETCRKLMLKLMSQKLWEISQLKVESWRPFSSK
jgi:hypothetical protein